jgi:hypothetical protein
MDRVAQSGQQQRPIQSIPETVTAPSLSSPDEWSPPASLTDGTLPSESSSTFNRSYPWSTACVPRLFRTRTAHSPPSPLVLLHTSPLIPTPETPPYPLRFLTGNHSAAAIDAPGKARATGSEPLSPFHSALRSPPTPPWLFPLAQSTRTSPVTCLHITDATYLSSRTSPPFLEEVEATDHAFALA